MKRQILSIAVILVICLSILPIQMGVLAADSDTIYVSLKSGNDSNSGTSGAPVKTLNKAVELAGGSKNNIYVMDSVLVQDTNSDDAPFVIDKELTIKGDASNMPTITVRAGGIILGANVTFENVRLGTASYLRPGIAANGYTLNLNNVKQDSTLRPLQIYGGTFIDYNTGKDYGEQIRGTSASNINITGGSYDAIYSGSANGSVALTVNINVSKGSGLTLGGIYVASTEKDPLDTTVTGDIPTIDGSVISTGQVNITVSDNAYVKLVDGVSESNKVKLTVNGTGSYSYVVKCIDDVIVNGGTFILAEGSSFGNTTNNIPNITLTGSVSNKATLDISECVSSDSDITVGNFTGSRNGILVVNKDYTLTVNGTLLANSTEFRTSKGMPWSSASNQGYSGWIEYDTTYINSKSGSGTFVITNPYPTQTDIMFTSGSSAASGWTTVEGTAFMPPELIDFTPISQTVSYDDANLAISGTGKVNIDVTTEYSEDEMFPDLSFVPFLYKVTYTSANGTVTYYKQQASVADEDGYYTCNYTYSTSTATSDKVMMKFEPIADTINICKGSSDIKAGTYNIALTATTTSGVVTKTFTLKVLGNGEDESGTSGTTSGSGSSNGSGTTSGSGSSNGSGTTSGSGSSNGSGTTSGSGNSNGSGTTGGSGNSNNSGTTGGSGNSTETTTGKNNTGGTVTGNVDKNDDTTQNGTNSGENSDESTTVTSGNGGQSDNETTSADVAENDESKADTDGRTDNVDENISAILDEKDNNGGIIMAIVICALVVSGVGAIAIFIYKNQGFKKNSGHK